MEPVERDVRARRRAWLAVGGLVACVALDLVFTLTASAPPRSTIDGTTLEFILVILPFPVIGIVILARKPTNAVGWILLAIGYAWVLPLQPFAEWALSRDIPGAAVAAALAAGTWAPPIVLMGSVLLLRFPNGDLLSPRWRWVERLAIVAMFAVVLVIAMYPSDFTDYGYPGIENPLGVGALATIAESLLSVVLLMIPVAIAASAVGLVLRYRRSRGAERLQMKWLTTAAAIVAVIYLVGMLLSIPYVDAPEPPWMDLVNSLSFFSFALIPIAIGFAVLRYRLYEIDVVISKAIVYGALAAFVTAAYVGIVVGLGEAIGSQRSVPLQIAATIVVAVAFQPLRERVQRFANRLVYGRRATPYEVLARFSEEVATTYSTDEISAALARLLVDGTGASRAEVWVRTAGEQRLEASWPPDVAERPSLSPVDDELTRVAPVVHRGERLGDLVIRKGANDPIGPGDEKLLSDVAGQAGLVLRNVRLIEDLKASRQRLVAARDTERRKLERNIHDGAQQRLVALAVLYNMAAGLAKPLGEEHHTAIAELGGQAQSALETLRELARGVYPAVLSDSGLVAALESQARKSPMAVEVESDGIGRYPQDVEAAVYFCCLEALQNVAKHAHGSPAVVRLEGSGGVLRFSVEDDGVGFEADGDDLGSGVRNMEDRIAAIGGVLEIRSEPGSGTKVRGRVPVPRDARALEAVG